LYELGISCLFSCGALCFVLGDTSASASDLLVAVLGLLNLLTGSGLLLSETVSGSEVLGGVFLKCLFVVVNQAETRTSTTAELVAEAVEDAKLGIRLVGLGKFFSEFTLGHVGTARVNYVHDELPALEQVVLHELACGDLVGEGPSGVVGLGVNIFGFSESLVVGEGVLGKG